MTRTKLGEVLSREWLDEPRAADLWDALHEMKTNRDTGISVLNELSRSGSRLSMMYLGQMYLSGQYNVNKNERDGIKLLEISSDLGSIEAGFRLAKHLHLVNKDKTSIILYKALAQSGYSPAMHVLGFEYLLGGLVEKNREYAIMYFSRAYRLGHVYSGHWLSHYFMNKGGLFNWFKGLYIRLSLVLPLMILTLCYPNSDRLRR